MVPLTRFAILILAVGTPIQPAMGGCQCVLTVACKANTVAFLQSRQYQISISQRMAGGTVRPVDGGLRRGHLMALAGENHEMLGVNAPPVLADVVYVATSRNLANEELVGDTMGVVQAPSKLKVSVSAGHDSPDPFPAAIRLDGVLRLKALKGSFHMLNIASKECFQRVAVIKGVAA